ncbi:MAG: hypothetical protein AB8B85_01575 [Paracoccaceae bacterium]
MAPEWAEIQTKLEALATSDKKHQAEGAARHGYHFEAPTDAAGVEAWLAEHGDWLDREVHVFGTIEEMFTLCKTLDEFRTGFLVREPELPFAMRLCSYWNITPPPQYKLGEADPQPETVQFRWLAEQYARQSTRQRFQGGLGSLLKMFPRKKTVRKG